MRETNRERLLRFSEEDVISGIDKEWVIEEATKLQDIKTALGLSHADSFDVRVAVEEILTILEFY